MKLLFYHTLMNTCKNVSAKLTFDATFIYLFKFYVKKIFYNNLSTTYIKDDCCK